MKNAGKKFEDDFQKSAEKVMTIIRLKDPAHSFNIECMGCKKKKTRFSPRNLCDFIGFKTPNIFFFELKSHKGASIPIKNLITSKTDRRLRDMAILSKRKDHNSFFVFNWREHGNKTFAIDAGLLFDYINFTDRKSVPFAFTEKNGIPLDFYMNRTRNKYFFNKIIENGGNMTR